MVRQKKQQAQGGGWRLEAGRCWVVAEVVLRGKHEARVGWLTGLGKDTAAAVTGSEQAPVLGRLDSETQHSSKFGMRPLNTCARA